MPLFKCLIHKVTRGEPKTRGKTTLNGRINIILFIPRIL